MEAVEGGWRTDFVALLFELTGSSNKNSFQG